MNKMENLKDMLYKREWKEKNQEYIKELQKFLDITDNIMDEDLRLKIIYQMLKCDEVLTKIAEIKFEKEYKKYKWDKTNTSFSSSGV